MTVQEQDLDRAVDTGDFPEVVRASLRLAEIDISWPMWPSWVIIQGHTVEPHEGRGVLVVDGRPEYSSAWL